MAVINAFAQDAVDRAEPLTVAAAYAQCRDAALAESVIGAIGLEIESHLVDLDHVADPVPWRRVEAIAAVVGPIQTAGEVLPLPDVARPMLGDAGKPPSQRFGEPLAWTGFRPPYVRNHCYPAAHGGTS